MASSTTNYNLIKPDYEDNADIKDLNDNFDTIDTAMNNKVDKEIGKGLSTNDYTTAEKTKLDILAEIKTVGTGLNLDDNGELTATGGGSGGTTNYNDLSNKPQINGNTLSGNKTSAQLGLASASDIPTTLADLSGDSTHRTVSDTEKAAWNNKSDFSGSYNDLTNKPTIPDELSDLTEDATHRTVTDTEKSTWNSKQNALTTAQLDAVNSGIDSAKVTQIETNKNNISLLETKTNTNAAIISQTYNSADCNMSVYLCQDNGAIDESTYYMTDQSKIHFKVRYFRRLVRYWKDGVDYQKYNWLSMGLIATNNSAKKDMLTLDIPEVTNETYVKVSIIDDDGIDTDLGFAWNKSSVNVGDVWYIRPYIVYTDLETGMEYTMYGAVYKVTVGTPCTIECDTLSCTELTAAIQAIQAQLSNQ